MIANPCPSDPVPVCQDCGRESAAPCPWGEDTCSSCSAHRDFTRKPCPAHGDWIAAED